MKHKMKDPIGLFKLLICVLLTQFGKTFEAIQCINMQFNKDEEEGRSIHMVFTMNTLLNNSQFAKRLEKIKKEYGDDAVIVFSSKNKGNLYKHIKKLNDLKACCSNRKTCPRVVVMCSNIYRFDDGVDFLKWIDDEDTMTHIKRCFVYYDELHKYISDKLRGQIEEIHELKCVIEIIGLTATPFNIWKTGIWEDIKIRYVSDFYEEDYCGYKDMEFCNIEFPFNDMPKYSNFGSKEANRFTISYIMGCIKQYPNILKPGSRVFIPGHVQQKSHFEIRKRMFNYNPDIIVVVLNGKDKTITYMDNDKMISIDISLSSEEVCTTIANKIKEKNIIIKGFDTRPLIITGFLCVGMGQTLTHKDLGSFTSAIIGHDDLNLDDIYQLFGRITGRMKLWDTYCKTIVYCPTSVMMRFKVSEYLARNMALKHNNTIASKNDYLAPIKFMGEAGMTAMKRLPEDKPEKTVKRKFEVLSKEYEYGSSEFDKEDDAIKFWGTIPGSMPRFIKNINEQGFMLCSASKGGVVLSYEKVYNFMNPEKGTNMSCTPNEIKPGKTIIRRYVCYKNIEINIPTFVIRWIKRV